MASGTLASLALTTSISCGVLLDTNQEYKEIKSDQILFDHWQIAFCNSALSNYKEVHFKTIAIQKDRRSHTPTEYGNIKINPVKAGKTKLEWKSESAEAVIWVKVKIIEDAWVFTRSISPGQIIDTQDINYIKTDIAHLIGRKGIGNQAPYGKVALRQIRSGDIYTHDMASTPPLINRNDEISILASSEAITLKTIGKALETGWKLGDIIAVKVDSSSTPIKAKVTGKAHVHVEI